MFQTDNKTTEFFDEMIGKPNGRKQGLIGLCRMYPAELEIVLMVETISIIIMMVVLLARIYCMCRKCCRPKQPGAATLSSVRAVPEEDVAMMPVSPMMLRPETRIEPEMPRCVFNLTIPNFNPFQGMPQGMPPPYHDVQQRPAIQDDRIQDVTSDYGVTQRRERVRRRESVYEAVGRPTGASAMAPVARAGDAQ